jgi:hypothetical protein
LGCRVGVAGHGGSSLFFLATSSFRSVSLSFFSFLFSAGFFLSFLACVASSFLLLYFFSCPGRELVVIGYDFDLQVGD